MKLRVVLLLLTVSASCYGLQGGIKVRLTKKGLAHLGNSMINDLALKLRSTKIPDVYKKSGRKSYSFKNIQLTHFGPPTLTYTGKASSGLIISLNGAELNVRGDWRYKYKRRFFRISDHGSIRAGASGINIALHATLGVQNSKPTLHPNAVYVSIRSINVKVRGRMGWLYNLLIKMFRRKIKRAVEDVVRKAILDNINGKVKASLSSFNPQVKVMDRMSLNYAPTVAPYFAVDYIEASLAGTFSPNDTNPGASSMVLNSERMLTVALSEASFNNFAKAAFLQNLLTYSYTDKKTIQSLMPANSSSNISLAYSVHVSASEAPIFTFSKDKISCFLNASVTLDSSAASHNSTLLKAHISTTPVISLNVSGGLVTFKVLEVPFNISLVDNDLVMFDEAKIQKAINEIITWLLPGVNEEAAKGVPLPNLKRIKLTNQHVGIHQGYISIASDISLL